MNLLDNKASKLLIKVIPILITIALIIQIAMVFASNNTNSSGTNISLNETELNITIPINDTNIPLLVNETNINISEPINDTNIPLLVNETSQINETIPINDTVPNNETLVNEIEEEITLVNETETNIIKLTNETISENITINIKNKQGLRIDNYKLISRTNNTYDLEISSLPEKGIGIKSLGFRKEAKIIIKGIKNIPNEVNSRIDSYSGDKPDNIEITTDVFAIDSLNIDNATIVLPKEGNVKKILKCEEFNLESFNCLNWEITNIEFNDLDDSIEFTVNEFSAYAGGEIIITKAIHLDSDYSFISDIYDEVSEKDDAWSEPIYKNQFVRVTFEENLTSGNDITFYARNNQGLNTYVEVYYKDSDKKITEFLIITEEKYYKIYLTGMFGSHNTFDLKIKNLDNNENAYLEFDYIVDPSTETIVYDTSFELDNLATEGYTAGNGWDDLEDSARSGLHSAHIDGSVTDATLSIDTGENLESYDNCTLSAWIKLDGAFDAGEYICMDYSTNGIDWNADSGEGTTLCAEGDEAGENDNVYHQYNYTVISTSGITNFRWRFRGSSGNQNEDGWVDDVNLTCLKEEAETSPTIIANVTHPETITTQTNFSLNLTITDQDNSTVIGYVQFYVNDSASGSMQSQSTSNNTNTLIGTLENTSFDYGSTLIAEFWAGDGAANTTKENTTEATVQCAIDADCSLCMKCSAGSCVNQDDNEDLKNECSASYDSCSNDYTRQGPDGYCDGSGACDTDDALLNVSAGNVCADGSDANPNSTHNCGTWGDCIISNASADEYYVGYIGDGTETCVDTDWQASGTYWNATAGYKINATEHADDCQETEIPTLKFNLTGGEIHVDSPLTNESIRFNITCTNPEESETITGYVKIFNGSNVYSSLKSLTVINDTETILYTLSSGNTTKSDVWTGEYWCGDGFSNSSKQNDSMTIGNTAPTQPSLTNPGNNAYINSITMNWTESSDADGDTVYYYVLVNETQVCYTTDLNCSYDPSDGYYEWNVTPYDGTENGTTSGLRYYIYDTTNPQISFAGDTENNNTHFNRTWIYVNAAVTETNENNITFYLYNSTAQINATNFTTAQRSVNFTNLNSNEVYYYNITVRDKAGNSNSTETRKITLDTTAPNITLNAPADNNITINDYMIFNFTAIDNLASLLNCSIYLNSTLNQTNSSTSNGTATLFNISGIADGYYSWNISCIDNATNINLSSTRNFEINRSPFLTSVSPSLDPIKGGSAIAIEPSGVADPNSDNLRYYCSENSVPTSSNTNCSQGNTVYTSPYSTMDCTFNVATDDTTHTIYCRVYDGVYYSDIVSTNYTIDSTPPTTSIISVAGDTDATYYDNVDDSVTTIIISGESGMLCRYYASDTAYNAGTGTVCTTVGTNATCSPVTDTQGPDVYNFYVSCADNLSNGQNTSQNLDITSLVTDWTAPTTSDNSNTNVQVPTYTVTITEADNIDGDPTTYYCTDTTGSCSPTTLIDDGGQVSFTSSNRGTNYLRYHSIDDADNNQSTANKTININQLVNFSAATDDATTIKGGTAVKITTNSSDADSGQTLMLYVCNSTNVNSSGCIDGTYCSNTTALANSSCSFTSETDDTTHTWYAFMYDSLNESAANNYSGSYTTGSTALTITIIYPENTTYTQSSIPAAISLDEAADSAWYCLDACTSNVTMNEITSTSWSATLSNTTDGSHNITFYANNSVGNIASNNRSFSVDTSVPDNTPPAITVDSPTNKSYYSSTSVWLNITLDENGFWAGYSLDSGSITNMSNTSKTKWYKQLTSLGDEAQHNVTIYANDTSNNQGNKSIIFYVDTAAPAYSSVGADPSAANESQAVKCSAYWTDTFNIATGRAAENSSGSYVNHTATISGTSGWTNYTIPAQDLSVGSFGCIFYAIDIAGNTNSTSTSFTVSDVTAPTITINSPVSTTYTQDWVTASITLSESGSWAGYSLDGDANVTMDGSGTSWSKTISSLSNAEHTLIFYANDSFNNVGTNSITFTIDTTATDTTPPTITIISPINGTTYTSSTLAANITLNEDGSWVSYSLDGNANITMDNVSKTNWNSTIIGLTDGNHNITFYANDSSSNRNTGSSSITYFTIDANAPQYIIYNNTPLTPNDNQNVTCYSHWSDTVGLSNAIIEENATGSFVNHTIALSGTDDWGNYTINASTLEPGTVHCRAYANDTSGNLNQTSAWTFTVNDVTPPLMNVSYTPGSEDDLDPDVLINVSANISDNVAVSVVKLQYKNSSETDWNNYTMNKVGSTYYGNFTPTNADNYTFRVWTNDSSNNVNTSSSTTVEIKYDTTWTVTPSSFSAVSALLNENATLGSILINVTGEYGLGFDLSYTPATVSVCYNDTEPFNLSSGESKTISITATAPSTESTTTIAIKIDATNSSASPDYTYVNGTLIAYTDGPYLYVTIPTYPSSATQGDTISTSTQVKNMGSKDATGVWLKWSLPSDWTNSTGLNKSIGFLGVGETATHAMTATLSSSATTGTIMLNASSGCNEGKNASASVSVTVNATEVVAEESVAEVTTSGGGGGGGTIPARPSLAKTIVGEELFETEETFELVRGLSDSFLIKVTNVFEEADLYNVSLSVEGYLSQYLEISPILISKIKSGKSKEFTITITSPTYMKKGTYPLEFTITGNVIGVKTTKLQDNTTITSYIRKELIEKRLVTLIIHEVSKEEAVINLGQAEKDLNDMLEAGFPVTKASELLDNARIALKNKNYKTIKEISEQIKEIRKNAFIANELINDVKEKIKLSEEKGINVDEAKNMLNLAIAAFEREDFETAAKRAKDAQLTHLLLSRGRFNILWFLKTYWHFVLMFVILLSIAGVIVKRKLLLVMIERKIEYLDKEEVTINGLMRELQEKTFRKKEVSTAEYHKQMYNYEKRLSEIRQLRAKLRSKRAGIIKISSEIERLKKEDREFIERTKELQDAYYNKQTITSKAYKKRIEEYKLRSIEIEKAIAVLETKLTKREKLEELKAEKLPKKKEAKPGKKIKIKERRKLNFAKLLLPIKKLFSFKTKAKIKKERIRRAAPKARKTVRIKKNIDEE